MRTLRTVALMLVANTAGGCVPAMLIYLFQPGTPVSELVRQCKYGCVYSYCIGTLCILVMGRLAPRIKGVRRSIRVPLLMGIFVLLGLVGSIPAVLIFVALGWLDPAYLWQAYLNGARIAVFITLILGAIVTAFITVTHRLDAATIALRNRQLDEERARKLASDARLSALESRVHPHFLFNTLNSISALIRDDPKTAERTVERLAALLRQSLDSGGARLVPLRQELRVVRDYLEIEQTRFGQRLRYEIDCPAELDECQVPPFTLQTLVENCVKHVVSANRHGAAIRVAARQTGDDLLLQVSDDGPGFDPGVIPHGHGLDNLRGRLQGLFDTAGRLEVTRREGRTIVAVTIPFKRVPA